jgi:hypothetical protein
VLCYSPGNIFVFWSYSDWQLETFYSFICIQ